jgi:hypothetical protein
MKIVCIISPYYDYLTGSIIEGLQELGHDIIASEESNYAVKSSDSRIRRGVESADIIVVFSNRKVRTWLVENVQNPAKVFVDGSDFQSFSVCPDMLFKVIFKRELNKCWINKQPEHVYPLPFAAEKRYFKHTECSRNINVSFAANLNNNTMRYSINQRLLNRGDNAIFAGGTGECAYVPKKLKGKPIETPKYRELLYRSKIAINVAGAGYDCARYWEIVAAGAMLLTQELDIQMPNPFVDGEHYVVFRSLDEFQEKLDLLLADPARVAAIASSGYEHLVKHHTTAARAAYFLDIVKKSMDDDRYCTSFYQTTNCKAGLSQTLRRVLGCW